MIGAPLPRTVARRRRPPGEAGPVGTTCRNKGANDRSGPPEALSRTYTLIVTDTSPWIKLPSRQPRIRTAGGASAIVEWVNAHLDQVHIAPAEGRIDQQRRLEEPNSHTAAQQGGRHQYDWKSPARRWSPHVVLEPFGRQLLRQRPGAHALFRVVRDCDKMDQMKEAAAQRRAGCGQTCSVRTVRMATRHRAEGLRAFSSAATSSRTGYPCHDHR